VSPPRAPEPEGEGPRRPPLSCGALLGLLFGLLSGPAYIAWIAGVEGGRIWVVLGLILLIAGCASLAHWLMGRARR
jgi:uncharacterized membrane protein YedE/YeeE